jgi:hypothetical protein
LYEVLEVTTRSASVIHSQNGETIGEGTVSSNVVCGDEFSHVKVKLMSLICQNIFRNAKAGFVKLWSPLTQILRKARSEFTHHLDVVRVLFEPTLNIKIFLCY